MSVLVMTYNIIGFKLLKSGGMATYTLFLMAGGMTIPYFYGLIFGGEIFEVKKTIAVALILCGTIVSRLGDKRADKKQIFLCIAVFILNGFVSVVSDVHQKQAVYESVGVREFVLLSGAIKGTIAGILYASFTLCPKKSAAFPSETVTINCESGEEYREVAAKGKSKRKRAAQATGIALVSAVTGGGSFMLQLIAAKNVAAGVLYPFITGGSIVFSALCGALFFKEKFTKRLCIGVVSCFAGTLLFL